MSTSVNNPTAFSVYTNYAASSTKLSQSMSRLATGVKSVVDDGAGVGISERMRAQARSTGMARNNVDNAISALKTADGWMQRIGDMLGRMHELSIESNDATKTSTDRANIQAEFGQLQAEIDRIVDGGVNSAAKFNGNALLDGTIAGATQVGADSGQTIVLSSPILSNIVDGSIATVGDISTATHAASMITAVQSAVDKVSQERAKVGGLQSRFQHTRAGLLAYEDNIRSAESKIRDVDMARESSEMTKQQILSQVGNAMLTQANQLPSGIMQLLG